MAGHPSCIPPEGSAHCPAHLDSAPLISLTPPQDCSDASVTGGKKALSCLLPLLTSTQGPAFLSPCGFSYPRSPHHMGVPLLLSARCIIWGFGKPLSPQNQSKVRERPCSPLLCQQRPAGKPLWAWPPGDTVAAEARHFLQSSTQS